MGELKKWIPLEKAIPEKQGLYLITYINQTKAFSDAARYNPMEEKWFWDEEETQVVLREISAWMELPAPYQPEAETYNILLKGGEYVHI